ncbi:MAG TPA: hypothetical protein VMW94_09285, partial [Actinomycetes bacterium]|nr:hypothetical protein [Actinomycetes bacterium]
WLGEWHHWEELEVGGNRYGARISELRDAGWRITSRPLPTGGSRYRLVSQVCGEGRSPRVKVFLSPRAVRVILSHASRGRMVLGPEDVSAFETSLASYLRNRERR